MRLFVAVDLPGTVVERLAAHGRALADTGGWRALEAAAVHVTLVFLGEHPPTAVTPAAAALEAAWRPVGDLSLGAELRLPPRRPRVAAIAVEDPRRALGALQADVSARLAALNLHAPERREFLPHATVARRSRGPEGRAEPMEHGTGDFAAVGLALYASRLTRSGARYEALARFKSPDG